MEEKRESKICGACGGEAVYLRDADLTSRSILNAGVLPVALYRCAVCGHYDLYEADWEREMRERDAERLRQYKAMPDYRCPQCGHVGKTGQCPNCFMPCVPVTPDTPRQEGAAGDRAPKKPKKRGWFGRDPDKPDWEG